MCWWPALNHSLGICTALYSSENHLEMESPPELGLKMKGSNDISFFLLKHKICKKHGRRTLWPFCDFGVSFDVIMLSETWYSEKEEILKILSYTSYFLNWETRYGGRVLLLTKNAFDCEVLSNPSLISSDIYIWTVKCKQHIYIGLFIGHQMASFTCSFSFRTRYFIL